MESSIITVQIKRDGNRLLYVVSNCIYNNKNRQHGITEIVIGWEFYKGLVLNLFYRSVISRSEFYKNL